MDSFKASYILDENEILFLLDSMQDILPSVPVQYMLDQYQHENTAPLNAEEGLVYKKLAKKASGKVVLEPVVDMLARSALSSEALWIIEFGDTVEPEIVLKSKNIYLHIKRYPHISKAWKITPHREKNTLLNEFEGQKVSEVSHIDRYGLRKFESVSEIKLWIEDNAE